MSEVSNYAVDADRWNHQEAQHEPRYVRCNACYGTGEDRHGRGDCIDCEGYGDIEVID